MQHLIMQQTPVLLPREIVTGAHSDQSPYKRQQTGYVMMHATFATAHSTAHRRGVVEGCVATPECIAGIADLAVHLHRAP